MSACDFFGPRLHPLADVVYCFLHGRDRLGIFITDFATEFFFECHNQFHQIKRVCAEVFAEARISRNLAFITSEPIDDDLFDPSFNIFRHLSLLGCIHKQY